MRTMRGSAGAGSDWRRLLLLRRRDQAVLAGLVVIALCALSIRFSSRHLTAFDGSPAPTSRYMVDINRADWRELLVLPEIGPALSSRILADRAARGRFATVDELERVSGIGPKTIARLRSYLLPIGEQRDSSSTDGAEQ